LRPAYLSKKLDARLRGDAQAMAAFAKSWRRE
jgi:hypothetical protein